MFINSKKSKMRKLQSNIFVIFFMIFMGNLVFAQKINTNKADIQFKLKAYDLAIDSYEEYLTQNPTDIKAMGNLAEAYERSYDLIPAARWYERVLESPDHSSYYDIRYGKLLMRLGLYDRAITQFEKLKTVNPGFADQFIRSCEFAKNILALGDKYVISQLRIASVNDEFAPAFFNNKLIYNSFENSQMKNNSLIQRQSTELFRTDANLASSIKMSDAKNQYNGIGPVRYSLDGKKAVFTRNGFFDRIQQIEGDEKDMSIYIADVDDDGKIVNEEPLPVNGMDYSAAFACFGRNNFEIYFSSNKNKDNFDLYIIKMENGKWSEPVSLGKNVNTSGNEVTPYFCGGSLYFSSDYQNGLGGFDVFKTSEYEGEWSFPVNLGNGINSQGDDMYYIKSEYDNKSYFASNRLGSKGGFDIYSAIESKRKKKNDVEYVNVPKAVKLSTLEEKDATKVANHEIRTVSESEASFVSVASLEGARMVAYDEVIVAPSNVYFIQLASLTKSNIKSDDYKDLTRYGNIYKVNKGNLTKVRLGYFVSQSEAVSVLSSVKKEGFRDAFIVEEFLNTKELELLESSYTFNENEKYKKPEAVGNYKIKLAAYTNPLYFDVNKVKDLGVIEQWSKGKWTIFILSGYSDFDDANQAVLKVKNRGFASAEVVLDEGGILTTVKND